MVLKIKKSDFPGFQNLESLRSDVPAVNFN